MQPGQSQFRRSPYSEVLHGGINSNQTPGGSREIEVAEPTMVKSTAGNKEHVASPIQVMDTSIDKKSAFTEIPAPVGKFKSID